MAVISFGTITVADVAAQFVSMASRLELEAGRRLCVQGARRQ